MWFRLDISGSRCRANRDRQRLDIPTQLARRRRALHGCVAEIRSSCLYVDDAVVVWHESQIGQAEGLITDINARERPEVLLGGGGISLDEGDTPIPSVITDLCPTRVVWYSSP